MFVLKDVNNNKENIMKGLAKVILVGFLSASASLAFAADKAKTPMDRDWVCTTNASSSDVERDKQADEKMANTRMSVKDSFKKASANCRDCTKITCEKQ